MSKRKREDSSSGIDSSRRHSSQGLDEKKSKKGRSQKSNEQTVADFSEFSNRYERIFESGEDADVTFIVNEQEIRAHKLILSANSEYFRNMFKSAWAERTAQVIKKPNVDYEAFREVIRFLYCGKARLDPRNVMTAAKIGLELSLDEFLELCCDCIKSTVSIDNVLDYLIEIDKTSPLKLASAKQACMSNIVENTAKFFERYTTRLTETMMLDILQNDDLCIKESQLFQYVVVWGRHIQLEARKTRLAQAGASATPATIYHAQYLKPLTVPVSGNSDASSGTTSTNATGGETTGLTTPPALQQPQLQQTQPVDDVIMADLSAMFHLQPQNSLQLQPLIASQSSGAVTTVANQNTENTTDFVDTSSIVLTRLRQLPEEEREELKNILKKAMQRIKFPCMTPAFVKLIEKAGIVDPTLVFETYKYHALKDITATNFQPSFELMRGNNVLQIGPNRWRYTIRLSDLHKNEHIQSNNYTYEGMEWYLLVYLIRKNFLEMYVCIDEDKVPPYFDKLTVKIQFSVTNRLDNAKSTILKLKEYTFTKSKCEYNWGSKKIMERTILEDPRNGFVLNDTIMVEYGVKKIA